MLCFNSTLAQVSQPVGFFTQSFFLSFPPSVCQSLCPVVCPPSASLAAYTCSSPGRPPETLAHYKDWGNWQKSQEVSQKDRGNTNAAPHPLARLRNSSQVPTHFFPTSPELFLLHWLENTNSSRHRTIINKTMYLLAPLLLWQLIQIHNCRMNTEWISKNGRKANNIQLIHEFCVHTQMTV